MYAGKESSIFIGLFSDVYYQINVFQFLSLYLMWIIFLIFGLGKSVW